MKRICLFILISIAYFSPFKATAQNTDHLTKTPILSIKDYQYISLGEFKVDMSDYNNKKFVVIRNKNNNETIIIVGNNTPNLYKDSIRILEAGYEPEDVRIIVTKDDRVNGGEKIEKLVVNNKTNVYDSIVYVYDNGFILKNDGYYYYKNFNDESKSLYNILERKKVGKNQNTIVGYEDSVFMIYLPIGHEYYQSTLGHFYYLYTDNLIDYTVLVVDGKEYKLNDKNHDIQLKFSPYGNHWIAVYGNTLLIDGDMKCIKDLHNVRYIHVTDNKIYGYVASSLENSSENDYVIINGNTIVKNVNVVDLFFEEENWSLKFRKNQYYYKCDKNEISDITDEMNIKYFPQNLTGKESFVVKSTDGKHVLEYRYDRPFAIIDGKNFGNSVPFYATWNEEFNSFYWNTVEEKPGGKSELVIYKYRVSK